MSLAPSGIYKITNLTNNKIYVGQSQNVYFRRKQHFIALRRNTHENKSMQEDWNLNNQGFRWDVLEFCSIDKLNEREQYWINKLDTINNGYNQGWVPYVRKKPLKSRRKIKHYHKTR